MFEDEPSFFHAQNARTSAEGLHRRDGVALPLDVNEYQWPNVFDRETDATRMVCDMHVLDEMRRQRSRRCPIDAIRSSLRNLEVAHSAAVEPILERLLSLADVDFLAMPAGDFVHHAIVAT